MRQRTSFNSNWMFFLGGSSHAEQISFDDSSWQPVKVPHDWSVAGPFSEDHPSGGGGGYLPGGIGWYRKTFQLSEVDLKKIYLLNLTASTRTVPYGLMVSV